MISEQTYEVRSCALVGLAVALLLAGLAQGATWTVSPGESIQAAIDEASPGDTILVESGTYYEKVNVTKALTLKGIGMPVVDAMGSGSSITLSEDGTWLEGFVVTNASIWSYAGIKVISSGNTIRGNSASHNYCGGIYLSDSENNNISKNTASHNDGDGIYLSGSENNKIRENTASYNRWEGISLLDSENNNLSGNNASYNQEGISISYSENNKFSENNVFYNKEDGISLFSSGNNSLSGNNASHNEEDGISLFFSENNKLSGNNASYNQGGICISYSGNNTMKRNLMSGNLFNFRAGEKNHFSIINDIDTSNLVDGKPIYYLVNRSGVIIDSSINVGMVCCIDCDNITINNTILRNNSHGVYFDNTNNSTIENSQTIYNQYGIHLWRSYSNNLSDNNVSYNEADGIYIQHSDNNTLRGNKVDYNEDCGINLIDSHQVDTKGRRLSDSDKNILKKNLMSGNRYNFKARGKNNVDTSNLIDGKPIYYLVNDRKGTVIDSSKHAALRYSVWVTSG